MYLEDTDLCRNIRSVGFVAYYTGTASVVHHGGGSSKQSERSYFSDVVMCESMSRFLRKFRGELYGIFYRVAMCGVAFFRVMLIVGLATVTMRKSARDAFKISFGKWVNILRWSLGCEGWARSLSLGLPLEGRTECVMPESEYVLITAAYNEGVHIGATIEAVLAQSVTPRKWVIVSDGSTDNTDAIIQQYVERSTFIEFVRRERTGTAPSFVSKVDAIHAGAKAMSGTQYRYIGILDADITFGRDYYERIISKMHEDTGIGIAGGFIYERRGNVFRSRPSNTETSVAGAIQLFRRECYEAIGGHIPLPYGGEDWVCEILSRKNNWAVTAFPEIVVYHNKSSDARRGALRDAIRQGKVDYVIGSHPLFELAKCFRRVREQPIFLRALFRLYGFTWCAIKGNRKTVSADIVDYLRREQMHRLRIYIHPPRQ
jgi:GT2 family glycosyltransferase